MNRIDAVVDLTPAAIFPVIGGESHFIIRTVRNADFHIRVRVAGTEVKGKEQALTVKYNDLTLTNSFKMFDQNMALTGGLPSIIVDKAKVNVTELLALNIYSTYNINKNWHGVAQAKAVIFFILVAVLAIAQQWATRSKEVEQ